MLIKLIDIFLYVKYTTHMQAEALREKLLKSLKGGELDLVEMVQDMADLVNAVKEAPRVVQETPMVADVPRVYHEYDLSLLDVATEKEKETLKKLFDRFAKRKARPASRPRAMKNMNYEEVIDEDGYLYLNREKGALTLWNIIMKLFPRDPEKRAFYLRDRKAFPIVELQGADPSILQRYLPLTYEVLTSL